MGKLSGNNSLKETEVAVIFNEDFLEMVNYTNEVAQKLICLFDKMSL